jgi:metal-responsive CopG/Arc/MetJ family transcriptional regulator
MKIQKTFTIEDNISKEFDRITKENSINKSLFIENAMREFITKIKTQNEVVKRTIK